MNQGFTLVEVVIAISVLAILSLLTQQSIQQAVKQKTKIQGNIDRSSELRSAFKVIQRDIQMAFHFKDVQLTPPPPPPATTTTIQTDKTTFVGTDEKVDFTSLNNARIYEDAFESDQNEVGYYTSECRSLTKPKEKSNCLWRRVSKIIDEDVTIGGVDTVLLENVSQLKFKYYNNSDQEWSDQWDSRSEQDNRFTDRFPDAVEILLETDIDEKQLSFGSVVPIRHPNN